MLSYSNFYLERPFSGSRACACYSSESACVTSFIHVSPLIACGHPSVVTANNATCSSSAAARPSASPRRACEWTAPCELAPIASARWTSLLVRPSSGPVWLRAAPSCCKAAQTSGCSFAMCCGTGGKATAGFSERSAGDDRSIGGSLMCTQLQHKFWGPICGRDCRLRPSAEGSANDQPKASTRAARRCPTTSSEDFKAELRLKRRKSARDNCEPAGQCAEI
jgi:hypothetical protein